MSDLRQRALDNKLVSEEDLAALEQWGPYQGCRLAERLYRSGLLSDAQLVDVMVGLGATDGTNDLVAAPPPPAALGALSRALADKHRAIGLRVERSRLVVAMLDPSDTDAIEKISFFANLAVEPRVVRARVLFQAIADAYGVPAVVPDAGFLASRRGALGFVEPPQSDPGEDAPLPAPSPNTPVRLFGSDVGSTLPPADVRNSPLAQSMVAATGEVAPAFNDDAPRSPLALELLHDTRPAASPRLDARALEAVRQQLPPATSLDARDSLPPQVLRLLVPPLRAAVLFLVRDTVAVGWDGSAPTPAREAIRDVLLPLTASSTFQRALDWKRVAVGNAADPTTIERILWRHLGIEAPSSLAVLPILVGDEVRALLYIDRATGMLDDALIAMARQVGTTLADGIAPFVAAGTLFPDVRNDKLKAIATVS